MVDFLDLDGRSQAMTGFLLPRRQWTLKLTKICILSWISKGISWLGPTCNFSSHSQQKTIHTGHKSKGNDQQDKYLDVQQILMASSMGTAQRTVRRFCIYSDNSHRTSQSLSAKQTLLPSITWFSTIFSRSSMTSRLFFKFDYTVAIVYQFYLARQHP